MHLSRFFQLKPIVRWVFRGVKITAVLMHLSRSFQLKPIVRWVFRGVKKPDSIHSLSIPTIKYYHKCVKVHKMMMQLHMNDQAFC